MGLVELAVNRRLAFQVLSMLTAAGFDTDTAVGGLTAVSLLGVGVLVALPLFALPAILAGVPVSPGLVHTALLGIAGFVLYTIFGVIILHTERPLAALGRGAQSLWNWMTRGRNRITHEHRPPLTGLDKRLLTQRDTIRAAGNCLTNTGTRSPRWKSGCSPAWAAARPPSCATACTPATPT